MCRVGAVRCTPVLVASVCVLGRRVGHGKSWSTGKHSGAKDVAMPWATVRRRVKSAHQIHNAKLAWNVARCAWKTRVVVGQRFDSGSEDDQTDLEPSQAQWRFVSAPWTFADVADHATDPRGFMHRVLSSTGSGYLHGCFQGGVRDEWGGVGKPSGGKHSGKEARRSCLGSPF